MDYEDAINGAIGQHNMIALCTYSLERCDASAILDVVSTHQFALARREGEWRIVESEGFKETREALRESGERLRRFYESDMVGMLYWNMDGKITDANDKFLEMIGYTREDLAAGRVSWADMTPPEYRYLDERSVSELRATGVNKVPFEKEYVRKDGSRIPVMITGATLDEAHHNGVAFVLDITERKQAEEALNVAKEQAELYVDLMGHDINNMNQSAMVFLEFALETLEAENMLKVEDKVLIERPLASLQNSSKLIDNVRKLQKLVAECVKTIPTDLDQIFRELEKAGVHTNERDIAINIQHVPDVKVKANELLKDVFLNLITNAVKHSDEEKPLMINVNAVPVIENGHSYYKCSVEDNGPGIPEGMKGKLFNRFQIGTTKAHGKGLGLYLVRTLVEGYGGRVWIEDRVPGDYTKGARFVVLLPIAEK